MALRTPDKPGHENPLIEESGIRSLPEIEPGEPSKRNKKTDSPEELGSSEEKGGVSDQGAIGNKEKNLSDQNKGWHTNIGDSQEQGGTFAALGRNFVTFFKRRRNQAIAGVAGASIIGITGGMFGILQGPFYFVHFMQNLEKMHLSSDEDHSNERASKVILYKLIGWGGERGRMGISLNKAADVYEKRLLEKSGIRPVYFEGSSRLAGYEIVDEKKAKQSRILDHARQNGVEPKRINAISSGQNLIGPKGDVSIREANNRVVISTDYKVVRGMVNQANKKAFGRVMGILPSRLEKKRGGVKFHLLEKYGIRKRIDTRAETKAERDRLQEQARKQKEEHNKSVLGKFSQYVKTGKASIKSKVIKSTEDADNDGVPDPSPDAEDIDAEGRDAIDQANSSDGSRINISTIARSTFSAAAVTGVLCAAQEVGNAQADYKYTNNILPMMRQGAGVLSIAHQIQAGETNLDDMGAMNELMRDEREKTRATDANTFRDGLGEPRLAGKKYDLPDEAFPGTATEKSGFFKVLDDLPGLGLACDVQEGFFGLPVIKQVSDFLGSIASGALNFGLGAFGTSTEEVYEDALAAISGNTIDPSREGAVFGNYVTTGVFLFGNDNALAKGGGPMDASAEAETINAQLREEHLENSQKSFTKRYFDIYDNSSLASSIISSAPSSSYQAVSSVQTSNPFSLLASSFSKLAFPSANAATDRPSSEKTFGIKRYGFSESERNDERFENPLNDSPSGNKAIVEAPGKLEALNDKYGKCFGVNITRSGDDITYATFGPGEEGSANVLKIEEEKEGEYKDCYDSSEDLLRFRWYIQDLNAQNSAACYWADDAEACKQLGIEDSAANPEDTSGDPVGSIPGLPDISDVNIEKTSCAYGSAPGGCYQLPKSKYWESWSYERYPSHWTGSKCMVQLIAATSKAWAEKYPEDKVRVGDINASGHASHSLGEDVDINTPSAADMTQPGYSKEKTIEYGKLWMSTGNVEYIFFHDGPTYGPINSYAKNNDLPGVVMFEPNHDDHFHVRINNPRSDGSCSGDPLKSAGFLPFITRREYA